MADDAEEVAEQELELLLDRLDAVDRHRAALMKKVDDSLKCLAKARGVGFVRLETFRDELRRKEQARG